MKHPTLRRIIPILLLLPLGAWAGPYEAGAVVLKRGEAPSAGAGGAAVREAAASPANSATTAISVEKSGVATRLGFGQPADDVQRIAPNQGSFHPWVQLSGAKAGQTVACRLIFKAQSGDTEAAIAQAKTDANGTAICKLGLPDGMGAWPEGEYLIEFHQDGARLQQRPLRVGG